MRIERAGDLTEKLIDMDNDLRARVVGLEHKDQDKSQRLAAVELWQRQKDVESARHDERWTAMEARFAVRFTGLEESFKRINSSLQRINWMIITAVVSGGMAFLIKTFFMS